MVAAAAALGLPARLRRSPMSLFCGAAPSPFPLHTKARYGPLPARRSQFSISVRLLYTHTLDFANTGDSGPFLPASYYTRPSVCVQRPSVCFFFSVPRTQAFWAEW